MMVVNLGQHFVLRRSVGLVFCAVVFLAGAAAGAQAPNPTSAANPFFGSVTAQPLSDETLKLSLDDAVQRGLRNNLGLKEAENGEKTLQGEKNEALQEFLPTITLTGDTGVYQHDLAALGFGPGVISKFSGLFPGGQMPAGLSLITRDDLTEGQIHFSQMLFSGPVIAGWKAAGAAERAAHFAKMSARGEVVQQVATAYLHAIAAASEVDNAKALVAAGQVLLDHAHAAHEAGTAANLDELRARVQLQAQQQALHRRAERLEKDLILLKREIGIDPGAEDRAHRSRALQRTGRSKPRKRCARVAYKNRQDYQNLQNQVVEYKAIHAAYRSQRLPTLSFNGYYGTSTVNGVGTHGNFVAVGHAEHPSLPRGAAARRRGRVPGAAGRRRTRSSPTCATTSTSRCARRCSTWTRASKLVDVARSNVDLATRALSDETDRVNAGVDDNLPLVTAQATLATAQSNLVESLYQYNVSKLALARAAGVLEQQYRVYLGTLKKRGPVFGAFRAFLLLSVQFHRPGSIQVYRFAPAS